MRVIKSTYIYHTILYQCHLNSKPKYPYDQNTRSKTPNPQSEYISLSLHRCLPTKTLIKWPRATVHNPLLRLDHVSMKLYLGKVIWVVWWCFTLFIMLPWRHCKLRSVVVRRQGIERYWRCSWPWWSYVWSRWSLLSCGEECLSLQGQGRCLWTIFDLYRFFSWSWCYRLAWSRVRPRQTDKGLPSRERVSLPGPSGPSPASINASLAISEISQGVQRGYASSNWEAMALRGTFPMPRSRRCSRIWCFSPRSFSPHDKPRWAHHRQSSSLVANSHYTH